MNRPTADEIRALIVDDEMTFKVEAIRALKAFKDLKTYKEGVTNEEKLAGLQTLVNELVRVYGLNVAIPVLQEWNGEDFPPTDDGRQVIPIILPRKLSIITLLYQFAGIRAAFSDFTGGRTDLGRQRFAINLFRKVYPKSFAKLVVNPDTGAFVKPEEMNAAPRILDIGDGNALLN